LIPITRPPALVPAPGVGAGTDGSPEVPGTGDADDGPDDGFVVEGGGAGVGSAGSGALAEADTVAVGVGVGDTTGATGILVLHAVSKPVATIAATTTTPRRAARGHIRVTTGRTPGDDAPMSGHA
jgi:hypothetical protein